MYPTRTSLALAAVASASLLLAGVAGAQALQVADSVLDVRAGAFVAGAEIRLRNTAGSLTVVAGGTIDSVRTDAGEAAPAIAVRPTELRIPANGVTALAVRGDSAWLKAKPGRYLAELRLRTATATLRLPLVITLAAPPPVRALVPKLKVRLTNAWPFGRFGGVVQVPLLGGASAPQPGVSPLVSTRDGSPALATPGPAVSWGENGKLEAYPVALSGLRGGGTYAGDVRLGAGDEASKVDLTVEASDHVGWVLFVVFLGVLAGIALRRWNDVGRFTSVLRERELRLGERFAAALATYEAAGGPVAALEAEVKTRREALRKDLGTLRYFLKKDEAKFETLQKKVEALEAAADRIEVLAAAQLRLKAASDALVGDLGGAPTKPAAAPGVLEDRPRGLVTADAMLQGGGVSLDTLEAAAQARIAQAAFLKRVGPAYRDWAAEAAWLKALRHGMTDEEKVRLDDAGKKLDTVLWSVWDAADAAAFETRTPEALLTTVEDVLREVAASHAEQVKRGGLRAAAEAAEAVQAGMAIRAARAGAAAASGADPPVAVQTERAEHVRRVRTFNDFIAGVASFVAALLAMLLARYFDHAFGTASDYAAAFTFGFGTTAGFDLLASGLASLQPVLTRVTTRLTVP